MAPLYQLRSIHPHTEAPTLPTLLHTSDELGWGELAARTYHEPPSIELWSPLSIPVLTVGLVTSGAMDLEQRYEDAPWHGRMVRPNQFFLQSYHQPYQLRWQGAPPEQIQTLILKLHQRTLFRMIEEVAERDPAQIEFVEQIGFDDPLLLHLALALQHELEQPTATGPLYAQTATQMLAVHLICHYTTTPQRIWEPTHGLSRSQVQRIRSFVHDQLAQELTLATLAQQVNLSPYYFARMFRQSTGESPHQFVLHQRLERAQWLLAATATPLTEITAACGFANQSYLATVFKRHFGITPQRYRRQHQ